MVHVDEGEQPICSGVVMKLPIGFGRKQRDIKQLKLEMFKEQLISEVQELVHHCWQ